MPSQSRPPDYYGLLGVDETATSEEIKQAFWSRAKQFHPDRNQSPAATNAFLVLNEAYHVLRHDDRRQKFDAFRRNEMLLALPDHPARSRAWTPGVAVAAAFVAVILMLAAGHGSSTLPELEASGSGEAGAASFATLVTHVSSASDLDLSPTSAAKPLPVPSDHPSDTPAVASAGDDAARPAATPVRVSDAKALGIATEKAPTDPSPPTSDAAPAPIPSFPVLDAWEATASRPPMPLLAGSDIGADGPAILAVKPDLAIADMEAPPIEPEREPRSKKHHGRKGKHRHETEAKHHHRHHSDQDGDAAN